jgi:hypothetical protein
MLVQQCAWFNEMVHVGIFGISDLAKLALDFIDAILLIKLYPETHIQRQALLHDCLPRLQVDVERGYKFKYCMVFCTGLTRADKAV